MKLKEQALCLYKTAFPEDPEDFAKDFIDRFFDKNCRYTVKDGKIVSMLFLLDCALVTKETNFPAVYLYAAATHPDYRGQGLMAELIERAKDETVNNGKYLVTKPADETLFGYYGKFGFTSAVFSEDRLIRKENNSRPLKLICKEEYVLKREALLKYRPHITYRDTDYALSFYTLFGDRDTVAAVDAAEAPPAVKEFISSVSGKEDALLSAINSDRANFRIPGKAPFAMAIAPSGKILPSNIFFQMALD